MKQTLVPVWTKAPRWIKVDSEAVLGSTVATLSPSFSSRQTQTSSYSFTTSMAGSYGSSHTVANPLDASSKKISACVGVGIGIGVAVGVAVVGAMIWLFLRRRKQVLRWALWERAWDVLLLRRGMKNRGSHRRTTRVMDRCLESWMGRGVRYRLIIDKPNMLSL